MRTQEPRTTQKIKFNLNVSIVYTLFPIQSKAAENCLHKIFWNNTVFNWLRLNACAFIASYKVNK